MHEGDFIKVTEKTMSKKFGRRKMMKLYKCFSFEPSPAKRFMTLMLPIGIDRGGWQATDEAPANESDTT